MTEHRAIMGTAWLSRDRSDPYLAGASTTICAPSCAREVDAEERLGLALEPSPPGPEWAFPLELGLEILEVVAYPSSWPNCLGSDQVDRVIDVQALSRYSWARRRRGPSRQPVELDGLLGVRVPAGSRHRTIDRRRRESRRPRPGDVLDRVVGEDVLDRAVGDGPRRAGIQVVPCGRVDVGDDPTVAGDQAAVSSLIGRSDEANVRRARTFATGLLMAQRSPGWRHAAGGS